ncbi:MAG: DHHW family protein [Clostridium sp.]
MKEKFLPICFFTTICVLSIFHEINKDNIFSEFENKKLSQKPVLKTSDLISGEYFKKYEEYYNDQFPLRNQLISIKGLSEELLKKIENNDIIYGKDNFLFSKLFTTDEERINNNISAINKFIETNKINTTTMIVPSSYYIYDNKLPMFTPTVNDGDLIRKINNMILGESVDVIEAFKESNKLLYFKTDHHWTIDGAYIAYEEYCKVNNLEPIKLEYINKIEVPDFMGTHFSKSKKFNQSSDILKYYDIPVEYLKIGDKTHPNIFNQDTINKVDKYAGFIYGNNPISIIKSKYNSNGKKLLVIKDSYANSFVPFLSYNYEEVHIIDLRYYSGSLSEYISSIDISDCLILYNLINFIQDTNIIKMKL